MSIIEVLEAAWFGNKDSNIVKDLKLNLRKYLGQSVLSEKEAVLVAHSLATPLHFSQEVVNALTESLVVAGYTQTQIKESQELGSLMGLLNSYYKFKNFIGNHPDYTNAGLRMNAIAKHDLSKEEFESLSLAHSLINACEFCVKAHEQSLRKIGASAEKIHDVVRLASVLKAVSLL